MTEKHKILLLPKDLSGVGNASPPKSMTMNDPVLFPNQFAVMMADGATGHILTTKGEVCIDDESEVYVIFEDLETARLYIDQKQGDNDTWEFVIYNSENECVEFWKARRWRL